MLYCNSVLDEVLNKHQGGINFQFIGLRKKYSSKAASQSKTLQQERSMRVYSLDEHYSEVFLTKREAECMVLFLKGKTNEGVAMALGISVRTVEFYVKRMQEKLCCKTKSELIEKVVKSDFLSNVDF